MKRLVPLGIATLACAAILCPAFGQTKPATTAPRLKTEVKLDTPENALASYIAAWKNLEYKSIMACIAVTDSSKQSVAERYVNYYMWRLALERACIAKFGEEEGTKALSHVRSLDKQFQIDEKRLLSPNVEIDIHDRNLARVYLKREKERPDGLQVDEMEFRDDYTLIKQGNTWKIDYIRTYKLADPERKDEINYNATVFPKIAKRLMELTKEVKDGKIKLAEDVKDAIKNEWEKLPEAEMPKE